jgi:hypothetical protein
VYFQFLEAGEKHDNFLVVDAMVKQIEVKRGSEDF